MWGNGESPAESIVSHDRSLEGLLERAAEVGLKLKPAKLKHRRAEVEFGEHILSATGHRANPEKVRAIVEVKAPDDVSSLRCVLGMTNYLSKYMKDLSDKCEPL